MAWSRDVLDLLLCPFGDQLANAPILHPIALSRLPFRKISKVSKKPSAPRLSVPCASSRSVNIPARRHQFVLRRFVMCCFCCFHIVAMTPSAVVAADLPTPPPAPGAVDHAISLTIGRDLASAHMAVGALATISCRTVSSSVSGRAITGSSTSSCSASKAMAALSIGVGSRLPAPRPSAAAGR